MVTFKTRRDGQVFPMGGTRAFKGNTPNVMGKPQLPMNVRNFLSDKISKNIREGKPKDQAIAIAFSQTRKKFPTQGEKLKLPTKSPQLDQKKLRGLLITLLGVAIALRILRQVRK